MGKRAVNVVFALFLVVMLVGSVSAFSFSDLWKQWFGKDIGLSPIVDVIIDENFDDITFITQDNVYGYSEGTVILDGFMDNDITDVYYGAYSVSSEVVNPTGNDAVRVVIETHEGEVSYYSLVNLLDSLFGGKEGYLIEDWSEGDGYYVCVDKISEGVRCYWPSGDKLVFVLLELPKDLRDDIAGLEGDGWQDLLTAYLNKFQPTLGPVTCEDSDGGKNYFVRGVTIGRTWVDDNRLIKKEDICTVLSGNTDFSECSGENCGVYEFACVTSGGSDMPFVNGNIHPCLNGCEDGACIEKEENLWVGSPLNCRIYIASETNVESLSLKLITDKLTKSYSKLHFWKDEEGNVGEEIYSSENIELVPANSGEWGDGGWMKNYRNVSNYYGYHKVTLQDSINIDPGYYWIGVNKSGSGLSALNTGVFNDGSEETYSENSNGLFRNTDRDCYYKLNYDVGGCEDSDDGKEYYVKGICTDTSGKVAWEDSCTTDSHNNLMLEETYCGEDNYCYGQMLDCPNGCSEGKCNAIIEEDISDLNFISSTTNQECLVENNACIKHIATYDISGVGLDSVEVWVSVYQNDITSLEFTEAVEMLAEEGNFEFERGHMNNNNILSAEIESQYDEGLKDQYIFWHDENKIIGVIIDDWSIEINDDSMEDLLDKYLVLFPSKLTAEFSCEDSDGGINTYVRGAVSGNIGSGYPNEIQKYEDYCSDNYMLIERYCTEDYTDFTESFHCPNGCVDGACVGDGVVKPLWIEDVSGNKTLYGSGETINLIVKANYGEEIASDEDGWHIQYYTYDVNDPDNYLREYVSEGSYSYNAVFRNGYWYIDYWAPEEEGAYYTNIGLYCSRSDRVCAELEANSLVSDFQVEARVDFEVDPSLEIPEPVSCREFRRMADDGAWPEELYGYELDDVDDDDPPRKFLGRTVETDVAVYGGDEAAIVIWKLVDGTTFEDFSEFRDMLKETDYWSGGKVYGNNYGTGQYYSTSGREVYYVWYHDDVAVMIGFEGDIGSGMFGFGSPLDPESFVQKLQDNEFEPLIDKQFDSLALDFMSAYMGDCPSQVDEGCFPEWRVKQEPVVCPPHGRQETILYDVRRCAPEPSQVLSNVQCSPGICSGCFVPRYEGSRDNICIPYGSRLEFGDGDTFTIYGDELEREMDEFEVVINGDGTVDIEIVEDAPDDVFLSLRYDHFINGAYDSGEITFDLVAGESFSIAEQGRYDVTIEDNSWSERVLVTVEEIHYDDVVGNQFIRFSLREQYPAYCQYDGELYRQRVKDRYGTWASCQNNYECESNVCSGGECIEVADMMEKVKGVKKLFYGVLCRLASVFGVQEYNVCMVDAIGDDIIDSEIALQAKDKDKSKPPKMPD